MAVFFLHRSFTSQVLRNLGKAKNSGRVLFSLINLETVKPKEEFALNMFQFSLQIFLENNFCFNKYSQLFLTCTQKHTRIFT